MKEQNTGGTLARYLTPADVWAIGFGCIIGWGAFIMPGTTFLPIAGPGGTLIALAVGALIMLLIGRNYAYLMAARPGTGGVYAYTKEAFGRDHAFLCSWFLSLSYISIVFLNATALLLVCRTMFGDLLQFGLHYRVSGHDVYLGEVALSVAALTLVGLLFILKKPLLQRIQTLLALLLLLGSVFVTVACLPGLRVEELLTRFQTGGSQTAGILTLVLLSPWAFVGFDAVALETAHYRFPMKRSWRIIALSILCGAFVYAAMTLVSISARPEGYASWQSYIADLERLRGVENVPAFYAIQSVLGRPGTVIMGLTALAAILTGVIGATRATTRVLSTMAEDRILSEKFNGTTFCVLFIMLISIAVSFLGRNALEWFVELTTLGAIVGFGYTSASAWRLARQEQNRKASLTGAAGTLITGVFLVVQMIPKVTSFETMGAASFLMLALWCLLGFLFYWRTMRQELLNEASGSMVSSTVLFSLLLYSALMWFALRLLQKTGVAPLRSEIVRDGAVLLLIIFAGLIVMLYIQNLLRKRHERLEREAIRAEESSRAKSQFLFNMSHDIRTPMNAIIGYTDLARRENRDDRIGDYLNKIDTSSRHLLDLINDILEMSRIESGKLELELAPANLRAMLEDIREIFSAQMEEKELSFTLDASQLRHPWVLCDRSNLNRVLLNVIGNAYKFTPAGGSVSVSLWEIGDGEENFGSYELRVKDSGIGMSPEFAERIFDAFERERTSTVSGIQGTGLGLAITKNILELMGGTIEVVTAPGEGTEFIIRLSLPLAQAPEGRGEPVPEAAEEVDFTGRHVLLVEDNDINREIALMILKELGFTADTAANGRLALDAICGAAPGKYDLVLMDIQMPVMDGYEATRAIRALPDKERSGIPIVAMTANAFEEDRKRARDSGMDGHIAKPIDPAAVKATLRDVLGNNTIF